MANTALSHRELIEMVEKAAQKVSRERLPSTSYENGIPRSAITELCGTAKVEWLVHFFRDNPTLKVLWAEENFNLLPSSFLQMGINPNRIVYIEAKTDLLKVLRKALRFQIFDCIVSPSNFTDERTLKVLQLLSEKANTATILLANEAKKYWPIALQLEINRKVSTTQNTTFDIRIIKEKGSIFGATPL